MTKNLAAKKMNERLKAVVPTASYNNGTKSLAYGAWYMVSRYNTKVAKYIVLTAMIGMNGTLVGAVVTVEGVDGTNTIIKPRTYKQVVDAFTK